MSVLVSAADVILPFGSLYGIRFKPVCYVGGATQRLASRARRT